MTEEVKSPARLDITDLPRDPQRCTGSLRQNLVASVNYCKRYPAKLEILKGILKYVYNYIVKVQKAEHEKAKALEAAKRAADEAEAEAKALAQKEAEDADKAAAALLKLTADAKDKE